MTDREQIEEMAKDLKQIKFNMQGYFIPQYVGVHEDITARDLYDLGYRKIPENAVVLSKEEIINMRNKHDDSNEIIASKIADLIGQARKETAKEILAELVGHTFKDDGWTWCVSKEDIQWLADKFCVGVE